MTGPFASVAILTCECRNSGVHGELLVGQCGPGNCVASLSGWVVVS